MSQSRTAEQQEELLVIGATQLAKPRQRIAALKILVETRGAGAQRPLWRILAKSDDPGVQAAAIHLLALQRKADSVDGLLPYLDHERPEVRAAAAESIGFIFRPAFEIPPGNSRGVNARAFLDTRPPISIGKLRENPTSWSQIQEAPTGIRERLEGVMLQGATEMERTAAARALVAWPSEKHNLRIAEWGVWIDDRGELKLVQSVLGEIPPFVHQTGNRVDSFADRLNQIMIISKPIIHLTSDVPLAVDLQVVIRQGRPWFAYPVPDDMAVRASTVYPSWRDRERKVESPLTQFDRADLKPFAVQEGYPWIAPGLRNLGSISGGMGATSNAVTDLGIRWQSLIVTPDRQPWMSPPDVPGGEGYAWWSLLRHVPTSWIASRNEAERFLYYDGPTFAQSPVEYWLCNQEFTVTTREMFQRWEHFAWEDYSGDTDTPPGLRHAVVVRVEEGNVRAMEFDISGEPDSHFSIELPARLPLAGNAVESRLLDLLINAGLTRPEGEGLVGCWRRQFFQTNGTRVITLLSRHDYDQMCPLVVRPVPKEVARVGIVLTEL